MKSLLAISLLALLSLPLDAQGQPQNTISGKIIDSVSHRPIAYATIGLVTSGERKMVNGAITDNDGTFVISNISNGKYILLIDFLGYRRVEKDNVDVNDSESHVDIGTIAMSPSQTLLNEVTIASDKDIVENRIDKTVYNVDKDITSQNGVATDVLKKVPQVSVDVDGNVELQGNASVRFLINGKPSVLFGNNIAEVLQSIPASQIQTIEVITIPGAKYDAAGTGGIINIILKKNKDDGTNGNISISAGTRLENGSVNLNYRKNKFGIHAFFSGNAQLNSTTLTNLLRQSQDSAQTSRLIQNGKSDLTRHGYETGIGFDWDASVNSSFEGTMSYDYFGYHTDGGSGREFIQTDPTGAIASDSSDMILTADAFHEQSIDTDLGYEKKFKKADEELDVDYNGSFGHNYSHYNQSQQTLVSENIFSGAYGNNPGIENEANFQIDYTDPVTDKFQLETGAKAGLFHIDATSDVYLLDPAVDHYDYSATQSSSLNFKRRIYAGYLSFTLKPTKQFAIQSGARYERTTSTATFSNVGQVNLAPYNTVVPSIVFMYSFDKDQSLKLSYTRRIERPDYRDLNPYVDASDPENISTGNPALRPEIGDRLELAYSRALGKDGTMSAALFARNNKNDIQPYVRFFPTYVIGDSTYTDVTVRVRENIGHEDNYGLDLFGSMPLSDRLDVRVNALLFQRYIHSGISKVADVQGFNVRTNINVTYKLDRSLIFEFFGNYRSAMTNAQGTRPAFITYNLAFRKEFMHRKASIAATATNFLQEYVNQVTKVRGDNFTLNDGRQIPYRSFGINLAYKFGSFNKEKSSEDVNTNSLPED